MNANKAHAVVHAQQLTKKYGDLLAVDRIDFEIRFGECFGLLGPNGAGKTTTTKMIYGMLPLTSGCLQVLGADIQKEMRSIKVKIGVVPEETNLDFDLNVLENLEIYANYFNIPRREAQNKARQLLSFLDMDKKIFSGVEELSNGMKQRLLLARALMNDPLLLILDEPTTGLDPQVRNLIWHKLRILKENGVTQILTTHYMEEAAQLCDRLIIMHQGKILDMGSPQELITKHDEKNLESVFLKLTGRGLGAE